MCDTEIPKISEERHRELFHKSPDPALVFQIDDDRIIEANRSCSKMLGCSRNRLLKSRLWALFPRMNWIRPAL